MKNIKTKEELVNEIGLKMIRRIDKAIKKYNTEIIESNLRVDKFEVFCVAKKQNGRINLDINAYPELNL